MKMFIFNLLIGVLYIFNVVSSRAVQEPLDDSDEDINDSWMHPNLPIPEKGYVPRNSDELTSEYWIKNAQEFTLKQIKRTENRNVAKNIIMFLGDGMSATTVAATRVYQGGEEQQLAFEKFSHTGMSKTYSVDKQVSDSACTATAYLTGVKGNYGTIGVNAQVRYSSCKDGLDKKKHTYSIAKWAMDAGKDAGLVTTTKVTDASPAGVFAHTPSRKWESNVDILNSNCSDIDNDDIAEQLILGDIGRRLKVIMGGGRQEFHGNDLDPETGKPGRRTDKKNLIQIWQSGGNNTVKEKRQYVWKKKDLLSVNVSQTDRILGLFEPAHLNFNLDRVRKNLTNEPTLSEMTDKATDLLKKSNKGFFLFVEGGKIDHGHHATQAKYALDETVEFAKAIELTRKKFSEKDTLIVVTSDHAHTMTYSGYAKRGNNIFGVAGKGSDKISYMTLSYANGDGYNKHYNQTHGGRNEVFQMNSSGDTFKFPATAPVVSETHGGEDVVIYASGPWSHLFTGVMEQNAIPHMMAYAACIGEGLKACD